MKNIHYTETGRKTAIPPQLKSALAEHKLKGQNDKWVFVRYKINKLPLDENAFYTMKGMAQGRAVGIRKHRYGNKIRGGVNTYKKRDVCCPTSL